MVRAKIFKTSHSFLLKPAVLLSLDNIGKETVRVTNITGLSEKEEMKNCRYLDYSTVWSEGLHGELSNHRSIFAHKLSCELWPEIILALSCEEKERAGKARICIGKALISLSKSLLLGVSCQSVIDTENVLFSEHGHYS